MIRQRRHHNVGLSSKMHESKNAALGPDEIRMNSIETRFLFFLLLTPIPLHVASAQGTKADYQRMEDLGRRTSGKVFRVEVDPQWLPDGHHFWYRVRTGDRQHEFILVDLQQPLRAPAFDHALVAAQLSKATGERIVPTRLPFTRLQFSSDRKTVYVRFQDQDWQIDRTDSTLAPATAGTVPASEAGSLATIRPSQDKGGEIQLEIVNRSPGDIRTVWIDRRGKQIPYRTLKAGERGSQHTYEGHVWLVVDADNAALALFEASRDVSKIEIDGTTKLKLQRTPRRSRRDPPSSPLSPDGRYRASIQGDRFSVVDATSGKEQVVGKITVEGNVFEQDRFFWAPNSRFVVALQVQPGDERQVYTVESSPPDQVQPKLHQMTYAKPGDKIRTEQPRLFDVQEGREIPLDRKLFDHPWSLSEYRWRTDSSEFSFLYNARGHQTLRLVGVAPATGEVRVIIEETSKTFVDYTNKVFTRFLEDQDQILWMSERDGWNHLYRYDWQTGQVLNQVTRGDWVVRGVERIDLERQQIWFRASGILPEQDPYHIHHCRIDFDGSNFVMLTEGDGTHSVRYSPNREYLIDRYSRVDRAAITEVRRVRDGSLVCPLEAGDTSSLRDTGWRPAIPLAAKGRDGKTDIYGVLYLPTAFEPGAKARYPVIEYIYAGPHDSFVPKRFVVNNQARALAELGFIVVQIDGMGTNNRGKAFHDVCWKNLGDSGFPDRIAWLRAAAAAYPQMDLSRVGIYGGSAGGQSALRALLAHGDFYRVAVADCGCHDNRMDKIWWNEQWMGWPVGPHYAAQSNVTQAHKLAGKLLLIVGELDRNVDPASTLQVVNALIKADKDFDFLLVPGAGHGVGSGKYGMRRTRDFFVRHLHGVEPRSE